MSHTTCIIMRMHRSPSLLLQVAIKEMPKQRGKLTKERTLQKLVKEVRIMQQVRRPGGGKANSGKLHLVCWLAWLAHA